MKRKLYDALGFPLIFLDFYVLHHRFPKVCHLAWWLLNEAGYES